MRRTWTISLPADMSLLAQQVAKQEHRTKSELVREALRVYFTKQGQRLSSGAGERLARVGELAEFYRQRNYHNPTEAELRETFRGVRLMHERLKGLDANFRRVKTPRKRRKR